MKGPSKKKKNLVRKKKSSKHPLRRISPKNKKKKQTKKKKNMKGGRFIKLETEVNRDDKDDKDDQTHNYQLGYWLICDNPLCYLNQSPDNLWNRGKSISRSNEKISQARELVMKQVRILRGSGGGGKREQNHVLQSNYSPEDNKGFFLLSY